MVPPPIIQPPAAAKPVPVGREATRQTLRLRLSAPPGPTPTEAPPAVGVKPAEGPPAVEVKPSEGPPAGEAPARASGPFVILEPEYVDKPSAETEVDLFKDVSWLDDDVEMVIEYPRTDSVPPAPPPQAPTEGPAAKREDGEAATTTRTTMSGTTSADVERTRTSMAATGTAAIGRTRTS